MFRSNFFYEGMFEGLEGMTIVPNRRSPLPVTALAMPPTPFFICLGPIEDFKVLDICW